jgi:hypothetical protein
MWTLVHVLGLALLPVTRLAVEVEAVAPAPVVLADVADSPDIVSLASLISLRLAFFFFSLVFLFLPPFLYSQKLDTLLICPYFYLQQERLDRRI